MIEFRTLGTLQLRRSDGAELSSILSRPKRLALLAYLALATPRGFHRRDTLLGLFWPELDTEHARGALRQALAVLRRELGEEALLSRGAEEVGLDRERFWCDVVAFDQAAETGERQRALEVYGGQLLNGFFIPDAPEFERWLEAERQRVREEASAIAWALAEAESRGGRTPEARALAKRAVELAPDDEDLLRRVVSLIDRLGDRTTAITVYEAFAARLRSELDLEPAPETRAIVAAVRARQATNSRVAGRVQPWDAALLIGDNKPNLIARPLASRLAPVAMVLVAATIADFTPVSAPYRGTSVSDAVSRLGRPSDWLARPRIAVLAVENADGDSSGARFARAITEDITARLSTMRGLAVVAREVVGPLEGRGKTPREIAAAVQASALFKGSARRSGNRVRVVAHLVDPQTQAYLWAGSFDRDLQDVFAVQGEIADSVAHALRVALTDDDRRLVRRRRSTNWNASELAEEARRVWNNACANAFVTSCPNVPDPAEVRRRREYAMSLVIQALELDPRFGAAAAMRASWRDHLARVFGGPPVPMESTEAALRSAVAMDSTDARSWRALGLFYSMIAQRPRSAAEAHLRVFQLDPNYVGAVSQLEVAWARTGRFLEAARLKVRQHSVSANSSGAPVARISLLLGDYTTADAWYNHIVRGYPEDALSHSELAEIWFLDGKVTEALAGVAEALKKGRGPSDEVAIRNLAATMHLLLGEYGTAAALLTPIADRPVLPTYFEVRSTTNLAFAYTKLGKRRDADSLFAISRELDLRELAQGAETAGQSLDLARIAALHGDRTEAYRWLEAAIATGWRLCYRVGQGMNDPLFQALREERRFGRLMADVKADVDAQRAALEASEDRIRLPRPER